MTLAAGCRVYEQTTVFATTGPNLRPGGLELTGQLVTRAALPPLALVLDVGCGTGATVDYLGRQHHLRALGLEYSAKLLGAGVMRQPDLPVLQAAGDQLPLATGQFDAVLAECSLSVMGQPGWALAEFRRVLRPGGLLLLHDVYARHPEGLARLRSLPFESCLRGAWSQPELLAGLAAAGLKLVWWADCSDALRQFVGQLIFAHGSLAQFWCRAGVNTVDPQEIQQAVTLAKPGYFALIAVNS